MQAWPPPSLPNSPLVPQPISHQLPSSSLGPFLLGDLSPGSQATSSDLQRVSRILASFLFCATHSSHHLTDQIIYKSQQCGSLIGSFIQPTQHNTFLPAVLKNGTKESSRISFCDYFQAATEVTVFWKNREVAWYIATNIFLRKNIRHEDSYCVRHF